MLFLQDDINLTLQVWQFCGYAAREYELRAPKLSTQKSAVLYRLPPKGFQEINSLYDLYLSPQSYNMFHPEVNMDNMSN